MRTLHSNQQLILKYLLGYKDGATLDEISEHIGITKTAVKEHILKLENYGYLTFTDARGAVGRPRRRYQLTNDGHDVFPKQYSWLSNVLLELLAEDLERDGIAKLMKSLGEKVALSMGDKFKDLTPKELIIKINEVMNDLGYQTAIKQSDIRKGVVLEATNCVYHAIAQKHPELCSFDVHFLKKASGMSVKLESCIARGGSVCRFCLTKER
ncbi:helix-turn-helix transcriptional regulator [Bdellovibrio bacteriovorus]|uniref:helix-turn-helix transcriptional regulator n=1 Tax=Bdellovibrio bacteriovorus TaxID=959 RepID=UPI0035A694AC